MSSARVFSTLRQQALLHPHLLLRASKPEDVTAMGTTDLGGRPQDRLRLRDPDEVSEIDRLVDRQTGRLSALVTRESDHLRGDVSVRVSYDRWAETSGLLFPGRVSVEVDGSPVRTEERSPVVVNPELGADLLRFSAGGILPGSNFVLWSKDLDDALVALKLNVDPLTILGGHGNVDSAGKHLPIPYPMFKAQLGTAMASTP